MQYQARRPVRWEHAAATGTAAQLTFAAAEGIHHIVSQVVASYNADVTGILTIENGANNVQFSATVVKAGPAPIILDPPLLGDEDTLLRVTLSAVPGAVARLSVARDHT